MTEFIEYLKTAAQSQIGGGVLLMSVVGSTIALFRKTPQRILAFISRRMFVHVDIQDKNYLFEVMERWLNSLDAMQGSRNMTAKIYNGIITYSPAPGHHFFWIDGRPIWLMKEREEKDSGYPIEQIRIRTIGKDSKVIRKLIGDAKSYVDGLEGKPGIYVVRWSDWMRMSDLPDRPLDTVVLPDNVMEDIVKDVRTFLDSREWYESNGIPWRRGYLLEGAPGTGKTSLVTAIANEFCLNTYICNVGTSGMTDDKLMNLIYSIPSGSIILMEDIDAVLNGRDIKKVSDTGVTFTGLLNVIDGLSSSPGTLTFMTTNHIEKLDPALVRRGRMDYRVSFGPATKDQVQRYIKRYFPYATEGELACLGDLLQGKVIADIQHIVMEHRGSINGLIEAVHRMYMPDFDSHVAAVQLDIIRKVKKGPVLLSEIDAPETILRYAVTGLVERGKVEVDDQYVRLP